MTQPTTLKEVLGEKQRSASSKKKPASARSYLWQIIRLSAARCSMASWGIPFEAIAASMLLRDRTKKKRTKEEFK